MYCPFRVYVTDTEQKNGDKIVKLHEEEYQPCYKSDCPFYYRTEKNEHCEKAERMYELKR